MNVAAVRQLKQPSPRARALAEALEFANGQKCVTRCACGWYFRGTVADGKQAFKSHLTGAKHTGRNHKRGPQQKTADRHAGRSWAK